MPDNPAVHAGSQDQPRKSVAVVGGGVAGLTCAKVLHDGGADVTVYEKAPGVGGRVRTIGKDGFKLDRGFQVYLEAYPEGKRHLDYDALDLHPFEPGALVFHRGGFRRLQDPWRAWAQPAKLFQTATARVGEVADKLKIAAVRNAATSGSVEHLFRLPERTTRAALRENAEFSEAMIDAFFRPFLGGVFLEDELTTSNRFFYFVFRMFALGDVSLPAGGIGAIPKQLADRLPYGAIKTGREVSAVTKTSVTAGGETKTHDAVVVACGADAAAALGVSDGHPAPAKWHATTCLYFVAEKAPVKEPILMLNGSGKSEGNGGAGSSGGGPINSLCVPSRVCPTYGSGREELISVSVLGDADGWGGERKLAERVRGQAADWFGPQAGRWERLETVHIEQALPAYDPPTTPPQDVPVKIKSGEKAGVYVCGDWRADPSLNGAMASGRRAAEAVLGGTELNL